MEIKFSQHSVDQRKIRARISTTMILDALRDPDEILESYRGRSLFCKQYNHEVLEIVTVKEDNKLIVITQYFLEQTI